MERWNNIPEFNNYEISDYGRVRNKRSGRILKTSDSRGGYEKVNLYSNGSQRSRKIHRLVATEFVDGKEDGKIVNHIDGNKKNNRFDNLEWVTSSENNAHAFRLGLNHRSEKCGTPKRSVKIIELDIVFESIAECARYLNVNPSHIGLCLSSKRCNKTCHGYTFEYAN